MQSKETRQEAFRRKERNDAHLYTNVQIVTSDNFCGHQGTDLYDPDKVNYRCFKVKKQSTLREFMELLSEQLKYPIHSIRPWPLICRTNQTCRPVAVDLDVDCNKSIMEIADHSSPWTVFLETVEPDSRMPCLEDFDIESDVLLFFKMYDPNNKRMSYSGHTYVSIRTQAKALVPILNERAGFPKDTELMLFEEVQPNVVERIEDLELPLEKFVLMDGDIIVFQRADINFADCELPTVKEYFRTMLMVLFEEGQGSDVKIFALGKEWNLHKKYLSQSPYFNSIFNGAWVETSQNEITIGIEDENISPEALHKVLGSLYHDEIQIEAGEAVSLMAAATLLQLDDLIEQCVEVMKVSINKADSDAESESGTESEESDFGDLIANIFAESEDESEFEGFDPKDIEAGKTAKEPAKPKTEKKKRARTAVVEDI